MFPVRLLQFLTFPDVGAANYWPNFLLLLAVALSQISYKLSVQRVLSFRLDETFSVLKLKHGKKLDSTSKF
jgi:hypothetical protein